MRHALMLHATEPTREGETRVVNENCRVFCTQSNRVEWGCFFLKSRLVLVVPDLILELIVDGKPDPTRTLLKNPIAYWPAAWVPGKDLWT
ncbi:hypothetical protein AMECASPLE_039049 [Ameca splendens]|uniref:Restriction endonuclease domain-containing protein n=1 Tax=Ameca splendens TaxID=208324 RepID=A0ABV0YJF0_9TELE